MCSIIRRLSGASIWRHCGAQICSRAKFDNDALSFSLSYCSLQQSSDCEYTAPGANSAMTLTPSQLRLSKAETSCITGGLTNFPPHFPEIEKEQLGFLARHQSSLKQAIAGYGSNRSLMSFFPSRYHGIGVMTRIVPWHGPLFTSSSCWRRSSWASWQGIRLIKLCYHSYYDFIGTLNTRHTEHQKRDENHVGPHSCL